MKTKRLVQIARHLDYVQSYPKNGNVGQQVPRCIFQVMVDGVAVTHPRPRLKQALEIARDYDASVTKTCVYDPVPIPKRI